MVSKSLEAHNYTLTLVHFLLFQTAGCSKMKKKTYPLRDIPHLWQVPFMHNFSSTLYYNHFPFLKSSILNFIIKRKKVYYNNGKLKY